MLYMIGYPSASGGARTEEWATLKLWRQHGVEVTVVPTWSTTPAWQAKVEAIGCKHLKLRRRDLRFPDGSLVVSFCSGPFMATSGQLRNCRLIYVPCMCYFDEPLDTQTHEEHGPFDAYVFQSKYQRDCLVPWLEKYGTDPGQCHLIHGAFDAEEFPYLPTPHHNGDPFVVGRLSRHDARKFSPATWDIYQRIPNSRARVMGWGRPVERHTGRPPEGVEVLRQCAEPPLSFLRSLHCMVHAGGVATENWPRVVLEAMAAGVPVVTDKRGGVCEMIKHGRTGYLCETDDEFVRFATLLAEDEPLRIDMTSRARTALEEELADPDTIWAGWEQLFRELGQGV